ncbi:hypothetical protein HY641_00955 [Candidatus Woesearchaeota archaeon]|nr:hypothetical protein [Candidatus Woesearchaeota archaeon]
MQYHKPQARGAPGVGLLLGIIAGSIVGMVLCVYLGWQLGGLLASYIGAGSAISLFVKILITYVFVQTALVIIIRLTTITGALTGIIGGNILGKLLSMVKRPKKRHPDAIDVEYKVEK